MLPIQIIYTISGFVALSAGGFQLLKLLKKRNSDELNLGTWLMWAATQTVSTAYAISLGDPLLIAMSAAWVSFYLFMSVLIIKFSSSRATLFKSVKTPDVQSNPTETNVVQGRANIVPNTTAVANIEPVIETQSA